MNRLNQTLNDYKGLSLIELVLVLALIGIVLSVGYSFLFTGTKTFHLAEKRSEVQNGVQLTADFITKEIRYSNKLEIIDNSSSSDFTDTSYFYIYQDGTTIKYRKPGESESINIYGGSLKDLDLMITFTKTSDQQIIQFNINGSKRGESPYHVKSDVLGLNLASAEGLSSNNAIRYKKQEP